MPDNRRVWTEDDVAKLKAMAGQIPLIAAQLGRTMDATAVGAFRLELSLGTQLVAGRAFAET
jgi:hypothetical protein